MAESLTTDILKINDKSIMSGQKIVLLAIVVVIVLILIWAICKYYKDGYITESVRSNSDRKGWDLRDAIKTFIQEQQRLLSKRLY